MTTINTLNGGEKSQRPTHKSLPRLIIPQNSAPEPEEITSSKKEEFILFCDENGFPPPNSAQFLEYSQLVGMVPKVSLSSSSNSFKEESSSVLEGAELSAAVPENEEIDGEDEEEEEIPTIEFDRRDRRELSRLKAELEIVKAQHSEYLQKVLEERPEGVCKIYHRNRRVENLKECQRLRLDRERLGAAIALIPERLRIRREFRCDFNCRWTS